MLTFLFIKCEKEQICYKCNIISTMKLSNKAYVRDTTIVSIIGGFSTCDMTINEIIVEKTQENKINNMELQGTVFFWEGVEHINPSCNEIIK